MGGKERRQRQHQAHHDLLYDLIPPSFPVHAIMTDIVGISSFFLSSSCSLLLTQSFLFPNAPPVDSAQQTTCGARIITDLSTSSIPYSVLRTNNPSVYVRHHHVGTRVKMGSLVPCVDKVWPYRVEFDLSLPSRDLSTRS